MTKPRITIHYCVLCQWLLRSGWLAQELLSTFSDELQEVAISPASKGVFQIYYNHELIWCREQDGGFPEAKILKRRVRDKLDPARNLGHIDN
ncbi:MULTISPECIES: SelT/SelW/SelH family protein [Pseudoalteromonas]|uniref:SelT/selW/selH selenoprotein domain-containing protein n=1 Tax=Pseudoalteromonas amylolytica TaxID=1859457 RepID=A0A1S1MX90_9GAMM|nr:MULTISPECIES: SelT/SelW/SelH family protein [Pseudoalteromonas]MCF6436898.1 SelT/SelW/SelH family protein [Pseudoalteromonas sp. MMG022]OHU85022.1 selT/selW/selH selenoprotein domain-containing protein [Pseudoalteromonas sp. JW3]OHU90027.1 selT/selW/selH selenoprotein domain-containing protein [Pseudoalteromonas amylolytica]